MTRDRAKELLPVIQAFAEGKAVEFRLHDSRHWEDAAQSGPSFVSLTWNDHCEYRIKPEPREWWLTFEKGDPHPRTVTKDCPWVPQYYEIVKVREVPE